MDYVKLCNFWLHLHNVHTDKYLVFMFTYANPTRCSLIAYEECIRTASYVREMCPHFFFAVHMISRKAYGFVTAPKMCIPFIINILEFHMEKKLIRHITCAYPL